MTGASALRLELRPSRALAATLVSVHLAAAAGLYLAVQGVPGMALATLAAGLGVATARDRALLRGRGAPRMIQLHGDGRGSVESADGGRMLLAGGSGRTGRYWVILELHAASRRHLLIAADMLDADSFRLLRLWSRWGRLPAAAPSRHGA